MSRLFVKDLVVGSAAQGFFSVLDKRYINYQRNGVPAAGLVMTLGDRTGRISAVAWNEALVSDSSYRKGDIVEISGRVQDYRGDRQVYLEAVRKASLSEVDPEDFSGAPPRPIAEMWEGIKYWVNQVSQPQLRELLDLFFFSPAYRAEADLFRKVPAGRDVHHAYVGGLMHHTLEVLAYCDQICSTQGNLLDRDLLISGALFHDAAKIWEYDFKTVSFEFTDRGRLLGHLVMGAELVAELSAQIPSFPVRLQDELRHLVLSHHGRKEWGSPEEPRTVNAVALHLADLTSSRMSQVERIVQDTIESGERWSTWDRRLEQSFLVPGGINEDEG